VDGLENVTVIETETVHLSCPLGNITRVNWRVRTILNGADHISIVRQNEVDNDFKMTGRYSATFNEGRQILTIINVAVIEAGEYECCEDGFFDETIKPVGRIALRVYGRWIGFFLKSFYSFNCCLMIL
jgi:hypothetical protein